MELLDFFPKYPNITKNKDELFNFYDDKDFNDVLINKKEFYDLKLEKHEPVPTKKGGQFKHQQIISRFLSSNTPYDQILLFHEMGTGKTCTAIGCIEQLRADPDHSINGALIIARGNSLLKNFMDELLFKCTDGRYIPQNYDSLTELQKLYRTKKNIGGFYNFETFERFAKQLQNNLSDEQITKRFSNFIIIIDEIHNIRLKNKTDELNIYTQIHRFLHLIKNCKVILMSGTPMKDQPDEIADIMNLILPSDEQFNKENFMEEYFSHGFNFDRFTNKIKGRISYIKSMSSNVEKYFIGQCYGDLKYFKLNGLKMSPFQEAAYTQAYLRDRQDKNIYTFSRQASLFVFPDSSYGIEGSKKYISCKKNISGQKYYSLNHSLTKVIDHDIDKLRQLSCKYANIIETLKKGEKTFIYCEYVDGSGIILLSLLLQHFGYTKANGNETTYKPRYTIITSKTCHAKDINKIIRTFNSPSNKNGELISILIGSKVISEGFTLLNLTNEFIITPHWNYSETNQAIARGWRVGSHAQSPEMTRLNIFQSAIITSSPNIPSIDLIMYEIAEKKDIQIKNIEYAIKTSSFDCWLNKERNTFAHRDYMRECDYQKCNYQCLHNVNGDDVRDVNTYTKYYPLIAELKTFFLDYFRLNNVISIDEILLRYPEYSTFEIVKTLVDNDIIISDKFNFLRYIRIDKNKIFLSHDPTRKSNYLNNYYIDNLIINKDSHYDDILGDLMIDDTQNKIAQLFLYPKNINIIIPALTLEIQHELLKASILAEDQQIEINTTGRRHILNYFKGMYNEKDNMWVINDNINSTYLIKGTNDWIDNDVKEDNINDLAENNRLNSSPIGYYGMYNPRLDNVFCIKEVQPQLTDLRKIKVGKKCVDFEKQVLTEIIARRMKIPIPPNMYTTTTRDTLEELARTYKVSIPGDFDEDDDHLKRVVYWGGMLRITTCKYISDWMISHNLMEENINCGQQNKKRNAKK